MNAPGCFGIPSVFNLKSAHCGNCQYFNQCRDESYEALKGAPESIAVNRILMQHEKATYALVPDQENPLPARVAKELELLIRRGMHVVIRSALVTGQFHLFRGQRPMRLAIELLPATFTKQELKSQFVSQLGWSEKSAWPQASWTWKLLLAMKVAIERGDRLMVHPNVYAQNTKYLVN